MPHLHKPFFQQEPARKRAKASSRGRSLSELLPVPKNAPTGGGRKLDLLGGGKAGGSRGKAYDSDDDEIVPGTEDRSGMVQLRAGEQGWGAQQEGWKELAVAVATVQWVGGHLRHWATVVWLPSCGLFFPS